MRQTVKLALLLLVTAILCSCASVSMVDTWRNPNVRPVRQQKVLVVSITRDEANRRVFEETLVNQLAKRGVVAVAGYTQITAGDRASWSTLERAMKQAAAQAVLTIQTIKIERQTTVQPGYIDPYPGYWYPTAFPYWDLHGYYGSFASYGPAYISTYDVATMQVNLFDAATGKLLWAATLESSEPENVPAVAKDLADKVVKSLAKQGMI